MQQVYLEPGQVPAHIRGGYSGKQFSAYVCEAYTVPASAGLWDGGSRDTFRLVRLADGVELPISDNNSAPWDASRVDRKVTLEPGFVLVEHTIFQGKDLGLRFYVHPVDAAQLLPAPAAELDHVQALVLEYTVSRKSSYNGKDRYDMARDDHPWSADKDKPFPSRTDWDAAKQALIARGYLNKAGAVTTAGRNANQAQKR